MDQPGDHEQQRLPVARMGRRIGALFVDWIFALVIARAFFGSNSFAILGVFALEQVALLGTVGFTFGHRIFGLRVVSDEDGSACGLGRAFIRTVLLCLVIPAVVWDSSGRGLHDVLAGTRIVRRS